MSDKKPEKKDKEGVEGEKAEGGGGGFLTKLPVLLGGVMVIEAAILFAGFKMFGGAPKAAAAVELTTKEDGAGGEAKGEKGEKGEGGKTVDKKAIVELKLVEDFRSPNKVSGHLYFYDVSVFVRAKGTAADKVKEKIEANSSLIKDRLRFIIAASDPEKLGGGSEPGLETFRRQVKFQLDEIVGDGLIDEVLVPKCIPFRTEF